MQAGRVDPGTEAQLREAVRTRRRRAERSSPCSESALRSVPRSVSVVGLGSSYSCLKSRKSRATWGASPGVARRMAGASALSVLGDGISASANSLRRPTDLRRNSHMFVFKAAVLGGGTMGGEIAQAIASADIPVVVKDVDQKFVDAALEKAREVTEAPARPAGQEGEDDPGAGRRSARRGDGPDHRDDRLRRLRRRRLRGRGGPRADGDQAGGLPRARRASRRATRSSPPTPPRSRSPRWARRRCGPTRWSASTSSTRPR